MQCYRVIVLQITSITDLLTDRSTDRGPIGPKNRPMEINQNKKHPSNVNFRIDLQKTDICIQI